MTGRLRGSAALGVALVLAGCTVGPDYERPAFELPAAYEGGGEAPAALADDWWTLFGDPALDRLVEEALAANQDLALAAARVEEARSLAGFARAERFPKLDAVVSASRAKLARDTANIPPEFPVEFDTRRATASLSFELDFWGRLARAHEAARGELLASEEGRRNVRLAVAAAVVDGWHDLASFRRRLEIARETAGSRRDAVRLQRLRFDAGTISELDLAQAEAELAATEAAVPALERALEQTGHRLAVVLGRIGDPVDPATAELDPERLPEIPAGLPSELLARRPDVVASEGRLAAANARIGVARAAYFPSIALTGYAGSESRELSDLFASGTGVWRAAVDLVAPVLHAGRAKRQLEAAKARRARALATYAKTVQTAFSEVEIALVGRSRDDEERLALGRQVEALGRVARLARLRYDAGESSYLEVLDAERNLFRAELDLAASERAEAASVVALVRALGGGWAGATEG